MCTLSVPSFIISLFTKEVMKVHEDLLQDMSKQYDIPFEELQKRYIPNIQIISNQLEKVNISKKRQYNKNLPPHKRCFALTKENKQCVRSKGQHERFCIIHENHQPYGTIDKPQILKTIVNTRRNNRVY